MWGTRHLAGKRLAFRNDYCRSCQEVVRAELVRSRWFLAAFWIPILPLGIRRRWLCCNCKFPVHATPAFGAARKTVLAVIMALVAIAAWQAELEGSEDHPVLHILFIVVLALIPLALVISAIGNRHDHGLRQGLALVPPTNDDVCPFCEKPLFAVNGGAKCATCGVVRESTPQPR